MTRARRFPALVAGWLALFTLGVTAPAGASAPQRFERDGVTVQLEVLPADAAATVAPRAGDPARVRFTIADSTGQPVRRLRPAAWFSRRDASTVGRPRTCAEKVRELLGGSIFSKAELDLNTFHVLALNDDATITVVDPLFGFGGTRLLAQPTLPGPGADWAFTPDGKRLFVSVPTAGKVSVIETATWKTAAQLDVGGAPARVIVQPDGHYAWVGGVGDGVAVIAADRPEIAAKIATGSGPHEIVLSPDSRWAFVTNAGARTLSVIDVRTLKKTKDVPLGGAPVGAAYSRASEAVYVTDEASGTILVCDALKHEVVARITTEPGAGSVRFAPGDRFGLVAVPAHDLVLVLDAATNRIVQRAKIEGGPEQFAFSGDMAFVRCRNTARVGMIPLKEIGREGQPLAVAEFTGGEAPFGARASLGESMMPAAGENAVVVANPKDKAIYYYMVGMAAPMGNFSNYDREPRALLVLDRSLREVAPGAYETSADLPAAGDYDVVFFLESPRIAHCFTATIAAPPPRPGAGAPVRIQFEVMPGQAIAAHAGAPVRVSFRLATGGEHPAVPPDLRVRVVLAPGTWHSRIEPEREADGSCVVAFTPPSAGLYYFHAEAPSLGRALGNASGLVLRVGEPLVEGAK